MLNVGNDSESSEGDDDEQPEALSGGISGKGVISEHVHYDSIARMPYRSRNAVYSPTPPLHDAHNDSGYSTRMYGSSKGASPSLSGENIASLFTLTPFTLQNIKQPLKLYNSITNFCIRLRIFMLIRLYLFIPLHLSIEF